MSGPFIANVWILNRAAILQQGVYIAPQIAFLKARLGQICQAAVFVGKSFLTDTSMPRGIKFHFLAVTILANFATVPLLHIIGKYSKF